VKSRKFGLFGTRRELRRQKKTGGKNVLRKTMLEALEKRELLTANLVPYSDGLYYPLIGLKTGDWVSGMTYREYARRHAVTSGGAGSGGTGLSGEGDAFTGPSISVSEQEPNNSLTQANFIPLGTAAGKYPIVNVSGSMSFPVVPILGSTPAEDYFSMDLRGGDIIDVRLNSTPGVPFDVTLLDSAGREIAGRIDPVAANAFTSPYGPRSPLSTGGNVSFAYTIPTSGRYYFRVADGNGAYTLTARAFRPTLEKAEIGTRQVVWVNFEGARVSGTTFGLPLGTIRLSPLTTYFQQAGLQPQDKGAFVREFMAILESKFQGALPTTGANGFRTDTGVDGQFDILFLNSHDHPHFDPAGIPHVTQLIVGGDTTEFPLPVRGISNSVDIGNFDTSGITIVLPDVFMNPESDDFVGNVPRAANVTLLRAMATAMAGTAAHELGHSFGAWHQDNTNANITLMDTGGLPIGPTRMGVGLDGIFGTADDIIIGFGRDRYELDGGNIGIQDAAALMSWALSTGTTGGGAVTGVTFHDRNVNRTFDSADARLPHVKVYADLNNDGAFNPGEPFTFSNANGDYRLTVRAGNHVIRQVTPPGYAVTTPTNNAHVITVGVNATVANRHFGSELVNQTITGVKWHDLNGNGIRDAGEPGMGGVWIYIDLDGDGRIDLGEPATQTAADGSYRLNFPGPGTYMVREVMEPGYVQTFPGASDDGNPLNDFAHVVVITGNPAIDNARITNLNFGNRMMVDFGDAPASYGIASHGFLEGLRLGELWDAEPSSRFSDDATGDDSDGIDDEDGILLARPLVRGSNNNQVIYSAFNQTTTTAYLNAWMDFNGDGRFGAGEQIATNVAVPAGNTAPATLRFTIPASARLGNVIARFRLSSTPNIGPTGPAAAGEVEDYQFTIVDSLQLAVNDQFEVSRNSVQNSLDVLANDFRLPGETIRVVGVTTTSAGGVVQIAPGGQGVRYTPPAQFIGQDVFQYTYENSGGERATATVVVQVRLVFDNPRALDDSFNVATNVIDFPLNVLANDIEGRGGALSILAVTQPDKGGQVTIATGGKSLRYTPARGFGGTEFFSYTVGDGSGQQSTANVTIHTLPGARANDEVQIRLIATDLNGTPISAIQQGDNFKILVEVDDLRFDASDPGVSAGVFAAYFDMLYSAQLVTTVASTNANDPFNYQVEFLAPYTSVRRGNADIPGIIDEFGAISNLVTMSNPGPMGMANITFTARSPGIATFTPDPADVFPASDTLLFNVPGSAVPIERIRYLGTTLEIIGDGRIFPVAVDDSVPEAIASGTATPINVLANDRRGSTGIIEIVSVTNGNHGFVEIDRRGTADPSDDVVVYTSNAGFNGADQFTYTIQDASGIQSTATVTVRVGQQTGQIVGYRLAVTDMNGNPVQQVAVGDQFMLSAFVQDLRGAGVDRGIFATYQDILYTSSVVSTIASTTNDPNLGFRVNFSADYNRIRQGDNRTPGLINEIGAVATSNSPLGTGEFRIFSVPMVASAIGRATFISDPADVSPLHDTLTFEPVQPVPFNLIRFGSTSINVVAAGGSGEGEHTNWANRYDVNADGYVSPIDILAIVNTLNRLGAGPLPPRGNGEGEGGPKLYVDTNADGSVSPIDILLVVNYLNSRANGEGEAQGLTAEGEGLATPVFESGVQPTTLSGDVRSSDGESVVPPRKTSTRANSQTDAVEGPAYTNRADAWFADEEEDLDDLLDALAGGQRVGDRLF
jgi:large repetitive protein